VTVGSRRIRRHLSSPRTRSAFPEVTSLVLRLIASLILDAMLHVVRGGGHLVILQRPAEITAIVTSYLDRAARQNRHPRGSLVGVAPP